MNPSHVFEPQPGFREPITNVVQEASYHFFGPLTSNLANSAANFIVKHCIGDRASVLESLSTFITLTSTDEQASTHSCWLCIRLTHPTDEYVFPRWHRDGCMFDCSCVEKLPHSKYAITLLGPSTRILQPSADVDGVVRSIVGPEGNEGNFRMELAEALKTIAPVPLETGQVVRFSWGQADSPLHSEPDSISSDRVFVSVMFGSEEEIRDMASFRNETYDAEKVYE